MWVVLWCSSTSATRLKGDKNEAINDDMCVFFVHPCRVMKYSNSRIHGYGLLGDLYLIIDNLNGYSKTCKIRVSAMACSSWGSRGSIHSGVLVGDLVVDSCTLLTSSLVVVVRD